MIRQARTVAAHRLPHRWSFGRVPDHKTDMRGARAEPMLMTTRNRPSYKGSEEVLLLPASSSTFYQYILVRRKILGFSGLA